MYTLSKHASMKRATQIMSSCHMKRIMASPRGALNRFSFLSRKSCNAGHSNTRCFSASKTSCWHIIQILSCRGTPSKHPVSLGRLWQPILKRKKRCMQRMDRGKSKSDLALRSAGLANQFLYVHTGVPGRTGPRANVQVFPDSISALPEMRRQDLDVNVNYVTLADRKVIPCTFKSAGLRPWPRRRHPKPSFCI